MATLVADAVWAALLYGALTYATDYILLHKVDELKLVLGVQSRFFAVEQDHALRIRTLHALVAPLVALLTLCGPVVQLAVDLLLLQSIDVVQLARCIWFLHLPTAFLLAVELARWCYVGGGAARVAADSPDSSRRSWWPQQHDAFGFVFCSELATAATFHNEPAALFMFLCILANAVGGDRPATAVKDTLAAALRASQADSPPVAALMRLMVWLRAHTVEFHAAGAAALILLVTTKIMLANRISTFDAVVMLWATIDASEKAKVVFKWFS